VLGVALLLVGGALILVTHPGFDVYTDWRQPPAVPIAIMGVILVWLALCNAVTRFAGCASPPTPDGPCRRAQIRANRPVPRILRGSEGGVNPPSVECAEAVRTRA
jgi:hypothetical protein